jgi:hypothetical protein
MRLVYKVMEMEKRPGKRSQAQKSKLTSLFGSKLLVKCVFNYEAIINKE